MKLYHHSDRLNHFHFHVPCKRIGRENKSIGFYFSWRFTPAQEINILPLPLLDILPFIDKKNLILI